MENEKVEENKEDVIPQEIIPPQLEKDLVAGGVFFSLGLMLLVKGNEKGIFLMGLGFLFSPQMRNWVNSLLSRKKD